MRKFYLLLSLLVMGFIPSLYAGESVPFYDPCNSPTASIVQDVPGQTSNNYRWQSNTSQNKVDQYYKLRRRNSSTAHNGTVFTKEIDFEAGKCYRVKVRVNSYSADGGAFKVNLATGVTQSTFDGAALMTYNNLERNIFQEFQCYFVPTQDMTRRIAFTDNSPKNLDWFYLQGIWVDEVNSAAPSAPTALSVTAAANNELKATIRVRAPRTTVDGKTLDKIDALKVYYHENLLYVIEDVTPGQSVNVTIPVTMNAEYRMKVAAVANGVEGQCVLATSGTYVGNKNLADWYSSSNYTSDYKGNGWRLYYTATYVPGSGVQLKYDPVSAKEGDTYTVKRMPDNVTLAENAASADLLDSEFLQIVEDNKYYWYEVFVNGATKAKATNAIAINSPVMYNFASDSYICNSNRNYKNLACFDPKKLRTYWTQSTTWISSSDCKGAVLMTPGIKLEAGKTYRIDLNVSTDYNGVAGFDLVYGKSNTPDALTSTAIPYTEIAYNKAFKVHNGYITPTQTDNYFFGIRAYDVNTDENNRDIYINRIHIEEAPADLPSAVEDLKIEFKSALEGIISFRTAANNVSGKPQQELDRVEIYKNGVLFKTINNATPGTAYQVTTPITPKEADTYRVVACNSLGTSNEKTTSIFLQAPPFLYPFNTADEFNYWTVVDGYRDGFSWGHQGSELRAFNSNGELAEWTFTPPVYLEAGKYYKVRFAGCTERETILLSAYLGDKPEILSMDKEIMAPSSVEPIRYNRFLTDYIQVPETKAYYFGFHGEDTIARKSSSSYHVYIDDFQVGEGQSGQIPGMGHMIVTPASDGSAKATVTIQQPTTDLEGNPLAKPCTKAYVYFKSISSSVNSDVKDWVEADLKRTIDLTSTDDVEVEFTSGLSSKYYHIFKVEFENEEGIGKPEEQIVYIGVNNPDYPHNLKAMPVETDSAFNYWDLSWSKPTVDINGYPLNAARVIYDIKYQNYVPYPRGQNPSYWGSESSIASNYADTTYAYRPYVNPNYPPAQRFLRYIVQAKACPSLTSTSGYLASSKAVTSLTAVGPAYELPYSESWPNGYGNTIFRGEYVNGMGAFAFTSKALTATPYDNDGGMLTFQFAFLDDGCGMCSGRINLNISKPVLRFALFNFGDADRADINTVQVQVRRKNSPWEVVAEKSVDEWTKGQTQTWSICNVDLSAYAGQVIEFAFVGICHRINYVAIDHVSIGEPNDIDITASNLILPEEGYAGRPIAPFTFTVKNNGVLKAEGVTAALYRNGVKVSDDVALGDIEPDELASCEFTDSLSLADLEDAEEFKYYAVATVADDGDLSDNVSATKTLPMIMPATYPTVSSLAGNAETETVRLTWTKPVVPTEPEKKVDDFESYPSWSTVDTGLGFYTLYDRDEMPIANLEYVFGTEWPIESYSRQSFVLANFSDYCFEVFHENFPGALEAHSGEKALVSLQNGSSMDWPVCDWIVSPKLPGIAQTITLYAKGCEATEALDVLYTTRDNKAVRNFKALEAVYGIPSKEWTKYEIELPDSTVYFAIEHYRSGGFALLVDDLEFTPLGNERLVLEGYNVRRNGELIARNFKPADLNADNVEYVDNVPAEGNYDYEVSAVYNRGESLPEVASVQLTSLTSLSAKAAKAYGLTGMIAVKGAEGMSVEVYTVDGMLVNAAEGRDNMQIAAPAGFYLVNVGNDTFKVTVK